MAKLLSVCLSLISTVRPTPKGCTVILEIGPFDHDVGGKMTDASAIIATTAECFMSLPHGVTFENYAFCATRSITNRRP
jgi:hypothetical protein